MVCGSAFRSTAVVRLQHSKACKYGSRLRGRGAVRKAVANGEVLSPGLQRTHGRSLEPDSLGKRIARSALPPACRVTRWSSLPFAQCLHSTLACIG